MDLEQILLVLLLVTWVAGGVVVAVVMRRSGHDLRLWLALGVLLGPFSALFAQERHQLDKQHPKPKTKVLAGPFDAVAGIDGSDESFEAVERALGLFGDRLSSLTLVTVLDYESSGRFTGIEAQSQAHSRLIEVASRLDFEPIEVVLLHGSPGDAITTLSAESGSELIIVGARGHGLSKSLLGSVAEKLIGRALVPVFVGPSSRDEVRPGS